MKSKILIFLFTILTFGLFLVPNTFAKSFDNTYYNSVNRINNIEYVDSSNQVKLYFDVADLNGESGYWYYSCQFFDDNLNNIVLNLSSHKIYRQRVGQSSWSSADMNFNTNNERTNSFISFRDTDTTSIQGVYILLTFYSSVEYNDYKNNSSHYCNIGVGRSTGTGNFFYDFNYKFIPNTFYGIKDSKYGGALNDVIVELRMTGTQSATDITDNVLGYNAITFNNLASNIASNNDRNTSYQYYIRVYFNKSVGSMINYHFKYLELMDMSINNRYYSYADARNTLPILYNNIVLYNDDSYLFTTNDLLNSGYSNYFIDYIDFRLVDNTFKSSSYYNSNLGVFGYINSTSITAPNFSLDETYYNGYNEGLRIGEESGYQNGYNDGVNSNRTGFDNMMLSVANVPMTIISSMLGFEILGVNLLGFFMGIITLLLFVKLMRKFKE